MNEQIQDIGFGSKYSKKTQRVINKDGSFNVNRVGAHAGWRNIFQHLITLNNTQFILLVAGGFVCVNLCFATIYFLIGANTISNVNLGDSLKEFLDCFFFSVQTISTVGYGAMSPIGVTTSAIASFESFVGLLGIAIVTGMVYARFSRPTAKFVYSKNALVSPYHEGKALMFRLANERKNVLMDLNIDVILVLRNASRKEFSRRYFRLDLEMSWLNFLPLSWTIVHPITPDSPLSKYSLEELRELGAELLILLKGYDDSFNQVIHSRTSYTADEFVENATFKIPYTTNNDGLTELILDEIHAYDKLEN